MQHIYIFALNCAFPTYLVPQDFGTYLAIKKNWSVVPTTVL